MRDMAIAEALEYGFIEDDSPDDPCEVPQDLLEDWGIDAADADQ